MSAKDEMVLRSLVRLLNGVAGLEVRSAESVDECNVVFLPVDSGLRVPPPRLSVHVVADPTQAMPAGLWVQLPLRAGNVGGVLEAAAGLLRRSLERAGHAAGLAQLFNALSAHLMARERRAMAFPFLDGPTLWVDFGNERCHCDPSATALLAERSRLGTPRRADEEEMAAAACVPGLPLRAWLWSLAHHLEDLGVPAMAPSGRYRLLRWPESVVLQRPQMPRLSALLTSRALDVEEACRLSGANANTVGWFVATSLALGLAELAASSEQAVAATPPRSLPPAPAPGLLERLKERLKLW